MWNKKKKNYLPLLGLGHEPWYALYVFLYSFNVHLVVISVEMTQVCDVQFYMGYILVYMRDLPKCICVISRYQLAIIYCKK